MRDRSAEACGKKTHRKPLCLFGGLVRLQPTKSQWHYQAPKYLYLIPPLGAPGRHGREEVGLLAMNLGNPAPVDGRILHGGKL